MTELLVEKTKDKKLFLVKCRGMQHNTTDVSYGIAYVIADNAHKAYCKLRDYLDKSGLGFAKDRELDSVTLLADSYEYTNAANFLIL